MDFQNKEQVAKALLGLYARQTAQEQQLTITNVSNGVGFNALDAGFCSSVAQWIIQGKPFTDSQFRKISNVIRKYSTQIAGMNLDNVRLPEGWDGKLAARKTELTGAGRLQLGKNDRLEFVPNVYPSNQVKRVGFSGEKTAGQFLWYAPFSLGAVNGVLRMFDNVEVTEPVQQLIDELTIAAELPEEVANHETLFPFQKESIKFLHSSPKAMLALAPGLGKTACSIFAADIAPDSQNILVVAPLTLVYNWRREIRNWVGQEAVIWHGKPEKWDSFERWVVTNYDTVRRNLDEFLSEDWDIVIIDESVLVKNRKAQRTAAVKALAKKADRVWMLSGSPTTRFYDDLWAQFNILDSQRFRSYWRFADLYTVIERNNWGSTIIANRDGADKMLQQDLADIYFSRTQDQVLDLPDWIIDEVHVPMTDQQAKLYKQMADEFFAELPEGDVVLAPNILARLTRLIQLASNPALIGGPDTSNKWSAVQEMLQYEQLPAIVWTSFIETAHYMRDLLLGAGFTVRTLTGSTPESERQEIVDRFQSGELDVIVAHPGVGKFGLTLTRARTAIYLERSYNGDDYYQSLHRIRRIGTKHSPHVIHLLSALPNNGPTVDHIINQVLQFRKDSAIKLTTGMLRDAAAEAI